VAVKNWVDIKAILATGQCLLFCNSRAFAAFENHVNKTFFKVLASLVIMKHIGLFF
jgi:hypothetical protein